MHTNPFSLYPIFSSTQCSEHTQPFAEQNTPTHLCFAFDSQSGIWQCFGCHTVFWYLPLHVSHGMWYLHGGLPDFLATHCTTLPLTQSGHSTTTSIHSSSFSSFFSFIFFTSYPNLCLLHLVSFSQTESPKSCGKILHSCSKHRRKKYHIEHSFFSPSV